MPAFNGDKTPTFFERALGHCYSQLETVIEQIGDTPHRFRKPLYRAKGKLQREAEYLNGRISGKIKPVRNTNRKPARNKRRGTK